MSHSMRQCEPSLTVSYRDGPGGAGPGSVWAPSGGGVSRPQLREPLSTFGGTLGLIFAGVP